jgi:formyltetrahydrofolate-dependent phosphoribosylglycinamide formyltransferase
MFKKLQQKWKVSSSHLFLILCTFAVTGTTTAFISRSITSWVGFDEQTFWAWKLLLRLSILIFGYQFIILIVAFLFGQFPFFWNYEKKILRRLGIIPVKQANLAIFASGKGSNAEKIIKNFANHPHIRVSLVVCNKAEAGVLDIAAAAEIESLLIDKETFRQAGEFAKKLKNQGITHIILAGFLWKIPSALVEAYPDKILNIHPALLPKYGGKGMYGENVHKAVIAAGDQETGITIHLVDEHYDHGKTIFQATIDIHPDDTPESLAARIHVLEHEHFPWVISSWIG